MSRQAGLRKLGIKATAAQCERIMKRFMGAKSKGIRYREFLRIVQPGTQTKKTRALANRVRAMISAAGTGIDGLRAPFAYFDDDGDGIISRKEFVSGLRGFGLKLKKRDIHKLLEVLDENCDNDISFDEFVHFVMPDAGAGQARII